MLSYDLVCFDIYLRKDMLPFCLTNPGDPLSFASVMTSYAPLQTVSSNFSIIFENYQNNLRNTFQAAVALEDADIPLGLFFTVV